MCENIHEKIFEPFYNPNYNTSGNAWWFIFKHDKIMINEINGQIQLPYGKSMDELEFCKDMTQVITPIQYMGNLDGTPCICAEIEIDEADVQKYSFVNFRSLLGKMDEVFFALAGRACHLLHWDKTNRYCGKCGTSTDYKPDERAKLCPKCHNIIYPRISPAIIVAIIKDHEILLAHSKNFRSNLYSVLAGFVEVGETFEKCMEREVYEEVGIRIKNPKYFGSQPWPFPDSLMVGFIAEYDSGEIRIDDIEIKDASWYHKDQLPEIPSVNSIAGRMIRWFIENIG